MKSNDAYTCAELEAQGSGKIRILLNDEFVGLIEIQDGQQITSAIEAPAGEYELTLEFVEAENLTIEKVTLK